LDFSAHSDLCALFEDLWKEHEALVARGTICPDVFHRNGRRIKTFKGAWKNACVAAGYPGRIPHDLRRSAVRNLVRHGVPDTVAMKITKHKTRAVFDRYDITSGADVRDGLGRLEQATGTVSGDRSAEARPDANPKREIS
jgi:integrase